MNRLWLGLASVLVLTGIGVYFWLQQTPPAPPTPPAAPVLPPPTVAPPQPSINYPVQAPPGVTELPPIEQADDFVKERLTELLGAKKVTTYLQTEGFLRRVVATVDNLARPLTPPGVWPIHRTPGRFTIETGRDGSVIGAANAARYAAFVALVESVDSARAVALYQRLYPLFQRSYEGLGYSGKYFNDRLVAVIDLLLDTPEPSGVLKVELPEIRGPLKPTRPWVLYRFADPALEGLASGQKILLRAGRDNEKRLKSKLAEIRKLIAGERASR